MAGPWERYAQPSEAESPPAGPWAKYAQAAPTPQQLADEEVRREMAMSPEDYDKHVREKVKAGGVYRPQPTRYNLTSDQTMDVFGLQDEIVGAGQFARRFITSGADLDEASKAYSDAAERVRAERRVARQANGIVPEIVGGFGSGGLVKGFRMAPTFLGRVGQSAKAGAGFGAVSGVAQGEGGATNRLLAGVEGAAVGVVAAPVLTEVAGPVIGAAARGTKAVASPVVQAVQFVRSRGGNVDARLNRALQQQNTTPRQALQRIDEAEQAARFGKTQLDSQFTLADTGPVTRDLADTAALVSSEARGEAGQFLNDRARGQFNRLNDYTRRALQVTRDDFARTQSKLVDEQRTLSKKAYDQAYADQNLYDVGGVLFNRQFDDFAAAGPLRRALGRARSLFVEPSQLPGKQAALTTERFDAGKRALDDMIQTAKQGGRNNEARLLTQLKHELLDVIDGNNPAYKAARDVYSSRADLLEAMDSGRAFMRGDAEMTGAQYRKLSTGEKRMFRVGLAREVRKVLGGRTLSSDSLGFFDKPNTRAVLEEIMSPAHARKLYDLVELEQAMAATNTAVRGNSKTAQRQQNMLDFTLGVRMGRAIKDQGLYSALTNEVFDQITKAFAMREADAVAVTRALFETDPAKQRDIVNRLITTYGKGHARAVIDRAERVVRNRVATARRSVAGLVGAVAADPSPQPVQ
jgi:hypothetical protein